MPTSQIAHGFYCVTHALSDKRTFLPTPWLYGFLTALSSLNADTHSSLLIVLCHHLLTFICRRTFSASSGHLNLGLPLLLLPSGLLSNIFLTVFPWSILITCPVHSNLFILISATISRSLYSSVSWPVHIFHIAFSTNGPNVLLNVFLSHISSLFISISVTDVISLQNTTAGLPSFY